MAEKESKELYKELFKNKANMQMTHNICSVCNNFYIIGKIIGENIEKSKKIEGFKKDEEGEDEYNKKIKLNNDEIYICFTFDAKGCYLSLWNNKKQNKKSKKKQFEEILNDVFNTDSSAKAKLDRKEDYAWIKIEYLSDPSKQPHTLKEKIAFVVKKVKLLEGKCKKIQF